MKIYIQSFQFIILCDVNRTVEKLNLSQEHKNIIYQNLISAEVMSVLRLKETRADLSRISVS